MWIMKPVGRAQGKGIFLFSKLSQISDWKKDHKWRADGPQAETYIVQKYIQRPYTVGGTCQGANYPQTDSERSHPLATSSFSLLSALFVTHLYPALNGTLARSLPGLLNDCLMGLSPRFAFLWLLLNILN